MVLLEAKDELLDLRGDRSASFVYLLNGDDHLSQLKVEIKFELVIVCLCHERILPLEIALQAHLLLNRGLLNRTGGLCRFCF